MLLAAIASGSCVPTWSFLNTLQLISHLSLFKSQLPAHAAFFMSQFLDICKFEPLVTWVISKEYFLAQYGFIYNGPLNMTFKAYGYPSMYLQGNIPVIIAIGALMSVQFGLCLLKTIVIGISNCISPNKVRKIYCLNNHASWVVNFTVRFLFETFLVISTSVLISLRKDD